MRGRRGEEEMDVLWGRGGRCWLPVRSPFSLFFFIFYWGGAFFPLVEPGRGHFGSVHHTCRSRAHPAQRGVGRIAREGQMVHDRRPPPPPPPYPISTRRMFGVLVFQLIAFVFFCIVSGMGKASGALLVRVRVAPLIREANSGCGGRKLFQLLLLLVLVLVWPLWSCGRSVGGIGRTMQMRAIDHQPQRGGGGGGAGRRPRTARRMQKRPRTRYGGGGGGGGDRVGRRRRRWRREGSRAGLDERTQRWGNGVGDGGEGGRRGHPMPHTRRPASSSASSASVRRLLFWGDLVDHTHWGKTSGLVWVVEGVVALALFFVLPLLFLHRFLLP